jgi:hypothetical protein
MLLFSWGRYVTVHSLDLVREPTTVEDVVRERRYDLITAHPRAHAGRFQVGNTYYVCIILSASGSASQDTGSARDKRDRFHEC